MMHIGIDLGTTNSVLAVRDAAGLKTLPIPQWVAERDHRAMPALPSYLYLVEPEMAASLQRGAATDRAVSQIVGHYARKRGAEVPGRLVHSAKSWLSHPGAQREDACLPEGAEEGVAAVSAAAASAAYLTQIADAWRAHYPDHPIEDQTVTITVPASFDPVARELTRQAAANAGLAHAELLEEPQAACYAWLAHHESDMSETLSPGDLILICDIGGGTSDFSLVEVAEQDQRIALKRTAVGAHLLLGGDNMDLALAHLLEHKLSAQKKKLSAAGTRALVLHAQRAKEVLLADPNQAKENIVVLGEGRRLIGGKTKTELTQEEVTQVVLDGFFPACALDTELSDEEAGLTEAGLPYPSDPAISRHLARFLNAHVADGRTPTHVLFNGGVMESERLRERVLELLAAWGARPNVLSNARPADAVAEGAAYAAHARAQGGLRIHGGAGHAFYIGIEAAVPAIPGVPRPVRAVCVLPAGAEAGTRHPLPDVRAQLIVGKPARFRFMRSAHRKADQPGDHLAPEAWPSELEELAPLSVTLPASKGQANDRIRVRLEAIFTELGTVEVWAHGDSEPEAWRLEFDAKDKDA